MDSTPTPALRIALPAQWHFRTELPLYIEHVNHGQHLDNARLIGLVGEARVRLLRHWGYSETDVEGVGIVVRDVAAQYRAEAFYGDTLSVALAVGALRPHGFDLVWQVSALATPERPQTREIARGRHGIVFFDYATRSKARVPHAFAERVAALREGDQRSHPQKRSVLTVLAMPGGENIEFDPPKLQLVSRPADFS
ncbi:acyl-CoA thioesterase [Amphibiibacter pelophylacis]|uniref:Acyl-CoA thioesterase n=1 Tax=Amphibiibacter pelophylacis TaxID=1799477 RepID=A0ACC6NXU6_9BURK